MVRLVKIERVLAQERFRCLALCPAVADTFELGVGVDAQHPIRGAVPVNVEPRVLTGDLRPTALDVEANDSSDSDVAREPGLPGLFRAHRPFEQRGPGASEQEISAFHDAPPLER